MLKPYSHGCRLKMNERAERQNCHCRIPSGYCKTCPHYVMKIRDPDNPQKTYTPEEYERKLLRQKAVGKQ